MAQYNSVPSFDVEAAAEMNDRDNTGRGAMKTAAIMASVFAGVCITVFVVSVSTQQTLSESPVTWLEEGADSCSNAPIDLPLNKCVSLFSVAKSILDDITSAVSGGSSSSTSALDGIAKPIMMALTKADPTLKKLGSLNFCLGTFTGAEIMSPPTTPGLELIDTAVDNCHRMPLNPTAEYSIMSFGVSQAILDAMGLCASDSANLVSMCVAYGTCENGLPTFAIQISGPMIGCMGSNPAIGASTLGIGEILGEAASLGISSVGFGISASGSFQMSQSLWAGNGSVGSTSITSPGNVYANVAIGLKGCLPAAVAQYISMPGSITAMIELGNGNMATEVATIAHSKNVSSALETLGSLSMLGKITAAVGINLMTITNNALPNLALGSFTIDALLSTQSVGGLDPGLYIYADDCISMIAIMEKALSWAAQGLSAVIDKASGQTGILTTASTKLSSAFSASDGSSKGQFGIFMNEASFGVLFEFPVGDLFPFPVPLGTMTLNCQFHFHHGGLTCGVNYDKPQWVAAVVSDGKMVIGNIKEHFDDALSDLKLGIQADWTAVAQTWSTVSTDLTPDHGKKIAAGVAAAQKAKLGGGRKVKAFFSGMFRL